MKFFKVTLTNSQTKQVDADGYVRADGKLLFHRFGSGVIATFRETDVWRVEIEKEPATKVPEQRMEA